MTRYNWSSKMPHKETKNHHSLEVNNCVDLLEIFQNVN